MKYSKNQLRKVLANWGLHSNSFKLIQHGYVNYNWLVTAEGKRYILRKAVFLKPKEFPSEVAYVSHLKKAGFPYKVPMAIRTKDGKFYVKYGSGFFWLYSYIEGEMRSRDQFQMNDYLKVARLYAAYHKALIKAKLHKKADDPFRAKAVAKSIIEDLSKLKKKKRMNAFDRYFLKNTDDMLRLYKKLDRKAYLKLPAYGLHQDINESNIVWNGKKIVGVLDFENVNKAAPLIRDFAPLFLYAFETKKYSYKVDLKKAGDFLKRYSEYRKPSIEEIRLMPDVLIGAALEDFEWFYWTTVNRPDKKTLKLEDLQFIVKEIKWYDRNRKRVVRVLIDAVSKSH